MGVKVPSRGRISRPCRGRSRSRMISGRSSDTTYEQTENLNPGKTSSVTAAPPRTCRRSRTITFFPARARYAADVSPLCPPPITIASYFICQLSALSYQPSVISSQLSARPFGFVNDSALHDPDDVLELRDVAKRV